jgi:hypothetical protein
VNLHRPTNAERREVFGLLGELEKDRRADDNDNGDDEDEDDAVAIRAQAALALQPVPLCSGAS